MKFFTHPHIYLSSAAFFLFIVASPQVTHAYIDPGTGSFIIQVAIAGIAVIGLYIKVFYRKIKGVLQHLFNKGRGNTDSKEGIDSDVKNENP